MSRLRRKHFGLFGLLVYVAGALVAPELHRRHHATHGADHVHSAAGTIYLTDEDDHHHGAADSHAEIDADLAAIRLGHVAHAGIAMVDCELAAYTLATCEDTHPHTFGDELVARHRHKAPDPEHGRSALEHFGAVTLATPPFLLPPPFERSISLVPPALEDRLTSVERTTHSARGPPLPS